MKSMPSRREFALLLLGAGLAGCATPPPPVAKAPAPMWPVPPEQPRYLYEAVLRNAGSLGADATASPWQRLLSKSGDSNVSFGKPTAVAAGRGRVYVTDSEGRQVFVFDLVRRRVFAFGKRLEGELKRPTGIALDASGQVYVVDATARRVVVYDELGLYVRHIEGAGIWARPTAVAVAPAGDRVYVVDTGGVESNSHRLFVYGADGRPDGVIGTRGSGAGEFNLPTDAVVARDGTLWVLDAGNFRVQAFDASGRPLRSFGSVGNGIGQFGRPRGLAVDRDGLVYVSDANFGNVQVFSPEGELMLALGSLGDRDAPGRYALPAKLASDETGRLYVVDQFFHKVEVLKRLTDAEGRSLQAAAG